MTPTDLKLALISAFDWKLIAYQNGVRNPETPEEFEIAFLSDGYAIPAWSYTREANEFHPTDPEVFWGLFETWRASFQVNKPGFTCMDDAGNDRQPIFEFQIEVWSPSRQMWTVSKASSNTSLCEAGVLALIAALKELKS